MKDYALYTTFNDSCMEMGMNMIYSFLFNNNSWFNGDIIILCDKGPYCNICNDNRKKILEIYDYIIFKDDCYERYKDLMATMLSEALIPATIQCYYKFDLLKTDEYKVKVYLDADMIVNDDISELFAEESNIKNGACLDLGVTGLFIKTVEQQTSVIKKEKDDYFNAGVMVIKDKCISKQLYQDAIDFCMNPKKTYKHKKSQHGQLVDQDIFNEMLPNVYLMPFVIYNGNISTVKDIKIAKIIHYCGLNFKPNFQYNNYNVDEDVLNAYKIYYMYDYFRTHKITKLIKNN